MNLTARLNEREREKGKGNLIYLSARLYERVRAKGKRNLINLTASLYERVRARAKENLITLTKRASSSFAGQTPNYRRSLFESRYHLASYTR